MKDLEREIVEVRNDLNNQLAKALTEGGFSFLYKEANGNITLEKGGVFVMLKKASPSYFMVRGVSFAFNVNGKADILDICSVLKNVTK